MLKIAYENWTQAYYSFASSHIDYETGRRHDSLASPELLLATKFFSFTTRLK